jgi:hypothetical protein
MTSFKSICSRISLSIVLGLVTFSLSYSQQIEITPIMGYMFGGSIRGYEAEASLDDNINFGGSLGFEVEDLTWAEFTYIRQNSTAHINRYGFFESQRDIEIATSYYHLGMTRESQEGDVTPFGSVSMGFTVFNPKEQGLSNRTFGSMNFGAGVKVKIGEAFGIRLQGRLMVPVAFSAGTLWCGTGGCGLGYASYATMVQGDFSLGFFYRPEM